VARAFDAVEEGCLATKPGELKVRWSVRENDVLLEWGGDGTSASDGAWINFWLSHHKGFNDTFLRELDARGFDVKTLRISVKRK